MTAAYFVALVARYEDRLRLGNALGTGGGIRFVVSMAELLRCIRADRSVVRAVILEPRDVEGRPTAGLVRQLTCLFPGIPVIGYLASRPEDSREILALASAGVHELIYKHQDDNIATMGVVLQRAGQACVADIVLRQLGAELPPRMQPFVAYCVANPDRSHDVSSVAAALDIDRKTLFSHCRAAGFPPPSTVIAWCLILVTAGLLASPGVTVQEVAMQLDFASPSALRNLLKRHTGLCPTALRTPRALGELCRRFLDRCTGPTPPR